MIKQPLFDVVKKSRLTSFIALAMMATGIVGLILLPFGVTLFNLDIDFTGGTTMQINMKTEISRAEQEDIADIVASVTGRAPSSVQAAGDGRTEVIIKTETLDTQMRDEVFNAIKEKYSLEDTDKLMVDNVSPIVGNDLRNAAILSTAIAVVLILVYITIRFNFRSGLAAICALLHDLLVMLSAYIIFQIPLNMNFIAAMLTILGYSINATIIVFDRVRENMKFGEKKSFENVVNQSVWQTMARSINTSFTTLIMVVMIIILGVESIRNFAVPMMVGIIAGCYSSVLISGPMWVRLRKWIPEKK